MPPHFAHALLDAKRSRSGLKAGLRLFETAAYHELDLTNVKGTSDLRPILLNGIDEVAIFLRILV